MKKAVFVLVLLTVLSGCSWNTFACTSFAVYSDQTIYGMNFDFTESNVTVKIDDFEDYNRVFYMEFDGGGFTGAQNSKMNEQGLFSAIQDLYPYEEYVSVPEESAESVAGFAGWTPYVMTSVRDVRKAMYESRFHHASGSFHNLFADQNGDAMVMELIDGKLIETNIENRFIVMSNFANALLKDHSYRDIPDISAERYAIAYEYISEHFDEFSVDSGFQVLENTAQSVGYYPTQYSIVFDPANRLCYFSIHRNFDKRWKVSLDNKTVETDQGFQTPVQFSIGEEGVPLSQLLEYEKADMHVDQPRGTNLYLIIGAAVLCAGLLFLIIWRLIWHRLSR